MPKLASPASSRRSSPTLDFAEMYALYPLGPVDHEPDALWLSYEWKSLDNIEWRPCVEHFLGEVAKAGHSVVSESGSPFQVGEDFVELVYLIDGVRTVFSSDHLLSLVIITTEDQCVLRNVWKAIGNSMGWVTDAHDV